MDDPDKNEAIEFRRGDKFTLKVYYDGRVEFGEGVTPFIAAVTFWKTVSDLAPLAGPADWVQGKAQLTKVANLINEAIHSGGWQYVEEAQKELANVRVPSFVLAATDAFAPNLVRSWAMQVLRAHHEAWLEEHPGATAEEIEKLPRDPVVQMARMLAKQMDDWQRQHGATVP